MSKSRYRLACQKQIDLLFDSATNQPNCAVRTFTYLPKKLAS